MNTEKDEKRMNGWRRYTWPTLSLVFLLLGLLIGNALSNKANAQRFFYPEWSILFSTTK